MRPDRTFFITGLPRTRSAWLANFFTYGKSFCFHDILAKAGPSANAVIDQLRRLRTEYGGAAGSGLILLAGELQRLLPEARWLIVRRGLNESLRSYDTYFAARPYPGATRDRANLVQFFTAADERLKKIENVLARGSYVTVDFEDLNSKLVLEEAWRFLTPGNPWDPLRCELLDELQINVMPEKVRVSCLR